VLSRIADNVIGRLVIVKRFLSLEGFFQKNLTS